MSKKIISIILLCIFVVSCFVISSFALTDEQKGDNYDSTHTGSGCCVDTNGSLHYDEGYEDGLLDGSSGKYSQEELDSSINEAIQNYINGAEYQGLIQQAREEGAKNAVEEYKDSTEYKDKLKEENKNGYDNGYNSGYEQAYDDAAEAMYDKGLADGYANFRNTEEYQNTIIASADGGYEKGYLDGVDYGVKNAYDPATLISLIITLIGVVLVTGVILTAKAKKHKK